MSQQSNHHPEALDVCEICSSFGCQGQCGCPDLQLFPSEDALEQYLHETQLCEWVEENAIRWGYQP